MNKIVAISKYGFMSDGTWYKGDTRFLKSDLFKSLKKGDCFDTIDFNKHNFVTSLTLTKGFIQECEGGQSNSPNRQNLKASLCPPSPDIKNGLMYGQCVNLAFNHVSNNELGLNIKEAFDLADDIYKEYLRRI